MANQDILEELEMMYGDSPEEFRIQAATECDDIGAAVDRLMALMTLPEKPKEDPMAGYRKLKEVLPARSDDELRAILAGFDDADAACGVVEKEPHLIDIMLKEGWTIEQARKEELERDARARRDAPSDQSCPPVEKWPKNIDELAKQLVFGPKSTGKLKKREVQRTSGSGGLQSKVPEIVLASYPSASSMEGTRGGKVTDHMSLCYGSGLHTMNSTVNADVVPAVQYIFGEMHKLPPKDSKRVLYMKCLAVAFTDCQAVQAREILRLYSDLTSQTMTLEDQLKYSLIADKERAIHLYITGQHPGCDNDHTHPEFKGSHKQRPHLMSGYTSEIGETFGLDEAMIAAANSDRFCEEAKREIKDTTYLVTKLRQDFMDVKEWLKTILADINNQSSNVDRLLDRDCIFAWVTQNMEVDGWSPHRILYYADRADEFAFQEPKQPTKENETQPFLSWIVLVEILVKMGMVDFSNSFRLFNK